MFITVIIIQTYAKYNPPIQYNQFANIDNYINHIQLYLYFMEYWCNRYNISIDCIDDGWLSYSNNICYTFAREQVTVNMGIDGLLKFLRPITQKQHISTFKNQRAAVDVMSWIYRGCYSCNFELSQNVESFKYLYYLLEMVEILSYYNIKPIFIFDGRSFDLKSDTNQKRIKQKEENKAKAESYLKQGNIEQARKYFSRCIFIDQKIISTTMNVMHSKNISFYVAPYEADCQIAKLKKLNIIDVAISQDSDLIAYGVNTILKLTQNGDCDYIDPNKWAPRDVDSQFLKEYFAMGYVNRVESAILAGSDYNPSVKGIGIKRAVKHMYRQAKMSNVINKLKNEKVYSGKIPQNYQNLIQKAKMIFLFATVYNPLTKQLEYLNPDLIQAHKPADLSQQELLKIVGEHYPEYLGKQVYLGKTQAKDLTERQITSINIRELFSINRENMLAHETLNKRRKILEETLKEKRQKDIEQGNIRVEQMKPNHPGSIKTQISPSKTELTEEEKEKRKVQRKNRIIKLQDIMNSVVNMYQEQDEQDRKLSSVKQMNQFDTIHRKLAEVSQMLEKSKSNPSASKQKNQDQQSEESNQSEEENSKEQESQKHAQESSVMRNEQESQQYEVDLAFLNPFAKNIVDNQKTAAKSAKK